MGKLKKRSKISQQRRKANQLAGNKGQSGTGEGKIQTLIAKISNENDQVSINEKLITINSIIVQCNNDESVRKTYLKNNLVKIVLTNLVNDSKFDEVIVSYLDLLRTILVNESSDISLFLWRNNIWEILETNFNKAFKSFEHFNDEKITVTSKDLLISYINNLIAILDNITIDLSLDVLNNQLLPKLTQNDLLNNLIKVANNSDDSIMKNIIEFFYDFSTISNQFIKQITANESVFGELYSKTNNKLTKMYIIGLNFQINEIRDSKALNVNSYIEEIFTNLDSEAKDDEAIDLALDLLTTIIEIKGSSNVKDTTNVFNDYCINKILPFLGSLFLNDSKMFKKLSCLNNLLIYLNSNKLINDNLLGDLKALNEKLSWNFDDFENLLELINFKLNLLEISQEFRLSNDEVLKLIEFTENINIDSTSLDHELLNQYYRVLTLLLTISAKISEFQITERIVQFLIGYAIESKINFYNEKLTTINISKFHSQYSYIIEELINNSINSIFEIFDDNYDYNVPLFHERNLISNLENILTQFRKIYKNIDKNLNKLLKNECQSTLENLQRFITYKSNEL